MYNPFAATLGSVLADLSKTITKLELVAERAAADKNRKLDKAASLVSEANAHHNDNAHALRVVSNLKNLIA